MLWETIQFYNDLFFFRCLVNQKSTFCQLIWFQRSLSQPQQVSILGKEHTRGLNNQIHVHITHATQHTLHQTPMNKIDNSKTVFRRISKDFSFKYIFLILCIELSTNDHFGKLKLLLSLLGLLPHLVNSRCYLSQASQRQTTTPTNIKNNPKAPLVRMIVKVKV